LSDEDWQYVLDERYLEDDVDCVPTDLQPEVLAQELRRLRRIGELPRLRAGKTGNHDRRTVYGWITDDESTMAASISDAMYWRARAHPEVQRVRAQAVSQGIRPTASEVRDAWVGGATFAPGFVKFVRELADYFGWDAEEAAVFVLTDSTPLVEPLRA